MWGPWMLPQQQQQPHWATFASSSSITPETTNNMPLFVEFQAVYSKQGSDNKIQWYDGGMEYFNMAACYRLTYAEWLPGTILTGAWGESRVRGTPTEIVAKTLAARAAQ